MIIIIKDDVGSSTSMALHAATDFLQIVHRENLDLFLHAEITSFTASNDKAVLIIDDDLGQGVLESCFIVLLAVQPLEIFRVERVEGLP